MNITVLTTKKKLSKAVVKQLKPAKFMDMQQALNMKETCYHIRGLGKEYPTNVGLFYGLNGWRILNLRSWSEVTNKASLTAPGTDFGIRGVSTRAFETLEQRDSWLKAYNAIKANCMKNHLII